MKTYVKFILIVLGIVLMFFIGLFSFLNKLAPDGHGSEANYIFSETKNKLELKIDSILEANPNVSRKELDPPPHDNYYNKGAYFTITIDSINFCFRYYGDSLNWNNNESSEIFIASITHIGSNISKDINELAIVEEEFVNKLGGKKIDK